MDELDEMFTMELTPPELMQAFSVTGQFLEARIARLGYEASEQERDLSDLLALTIGALIQEHGPTVTLMLEGEPDPDRVASCDA